MVELLEIYSDEGEHIKNVDKKESHITMRDEFFKTGKSTLRHKDIKLLLMTSTGRLILQRRSKWKGDNAGMWDKTVGGHVTAEDSYDITALKECAEELGIPATIVKSEEFDHVVSVTDLNVLGLLKKAKYLDSYKSSRLLHNGKKWIENSMTTFYVGYYDGAIRFIDKESCGIQVFTIEELEQEMNDFPDAFTDDMKYIVKNLKQFIKPAPKKIEHEINY